MSFVRVSDLPGGFRFPGSRTAPQPFLSLAAGSLPSPASGREAALPQHSSAQVVEAVGQAACLSADHRASSHASVSQTLAPGTACRSYPQQHRAAPVPDCCRGMSLVGTGEELAKPAEVPLLIGDVGCAFSGCKATVCSCQRAFLGVGEAEQLQVSGPKVK